MKKILTIEDIKSSERSLYALSLQKWTREAIIYFAEDIKTPTWRRLCDESILDSEIINKYAGKSIPYRTIARNQKTSYEIIKKHIIEKYSDELQDNSNYYYDDVLAELMLDYKNKNLEDNSTFGHFFISKNLIMSDEMLDKHKDKLVWYYICKKTYLKKYQIEKYIKYISEKGEQLYPDANFKNLFNGCEDKEDFKKSFSKYSNIDFEDFIKNKVLSHEENKENLAKKKLKETENIPCEDFIDIKILDTSWGSFSNLIVKFQYKNILSDFSVFNTNGYSARDGSFCFKDKKEIEIQISFKRTKKGHLNAMRVQHIVSRK